MKKIFLVSLVLFSVSQAFAGDELKAAFKYWSALKFSKTNNCSVAIQEFEDKYNKTWGLITEEAMFKLKNSEKCKAVITTGKYDKTCFDKYDTYFMDSKTCVKDKITLSNYVEDNQCTFNPELYCKLGPFRSYKVNVGQLYDETKCEAAFSCSENSYLNGFNLKKNSSYKVVCKGTVGGSCDDLGLDNCPQLGSLGMLRSTNGDELEAAAPGRR